MRPGRAKTSWANRETSCAVRAEGNDTATLGVPPAPGSTRTSGRTAPSSSRNQPRARSTRLSTDTSARA